MLTVTEIEHDHMPDHGDYNAVKIGMTLRQALKALRAAGQQNYGDMGGCTIFLSDNTLLSVALTPVDGGWLLSSQRLVRINEYGVVREYPW